MTGDSVWFNIISLVSASVGFVFAMSYWRAHTKYQEAVRNYEKKSYAAPKHEDVVKRQDAADAATQWYIIKVGFQTLAYLALGVSLIAWLLGIHFASH